VGASAWSYFIPYNENVQEALIALRQKVFEEKKYYRPDNSNLPATFEEWVTLHKLQIPPDKVKKWEDDFYESKRKAAIDPATIEELLELNQESGTHSIIDIFEISPATDDQHSGTLSQEDIFRLLGTVQPDRKMVETKAEELLDFRGRWFCTYLVVYKNGRPDELFFTGFSGD